MTGTIQHAMALAHIAWARKHAPWLLRGGTK